MDQILRKTNTVLNVLLNLNVGIVSDASERHAVTSKQQHPTPYNNPLVAPRHALSCIASVRFGFLIFKALICSGTPGLTDFATWLVSNAPTRCFTLVLLLFELSRCCPAWAISSWMFFLPCLATCLLLVQWKTFSVRLVVSCVFVLNCLNSFLINLCLSLSCPFLCPLSLRECPWGSVCRDVPTSAHPREGSGASIILEYVSRVRPFNAKCCATVAL